jgi:hypothetical protein
MTSPHRYFAKVAKDRNLCFQAAEDHLDDMIDLESCHNFGRIVIYLCWLCLYTTHHGDPVIRMTPASGSEQSMIESRSRGLHIAPGDT